VRGGVQSHEEKEIVAQVIRFFEQHGESRFSLWNGEPDDSKTQNRVGFRKFEYGETEFYVLPQAFNSDIARGFDPQQVSKICIKHGFLREGKDRTQCPVRLPGKSKTSRCYIFTSKVLGGEE
jgi:putative DNA primase/helicase